MKSINLLDSDTINAIAAGEVVERPASVVKELVENAVDAHATAITVEIRGGGVEMVRVTDNGSGIDRDDVETAFERHATSKICNAMDLLTVDTLGFRGEALSSIAAVSQVEIITKTRNDLVGVRYLIEGGEKHLKEDIGCPDGTTIIVRDLFYNTPARRKFLKTASTEGSYTSELLDRLALSRPDISFKFINNGQNRLHSSGNGSQKDIIYQIYGRDVTSHLLEAERNTELMQISGYIGKPILSRGNRNWENYFINGRYIKSDIVTRAIEDAYKTFVMIHKFPFTVLNLHIEPELTDVNVHPRKMEIRFNENEAVYRQVYDTVRGILENRELTPAGSLTAPPAPREKNDAARQMKLPEPFEINRRAAMETENTARKDMPAADRPAGKPAPAAADIVKTPAADRPAEKPAQAAAETVKIPAAASELGSGSPAAAISAQGSSDIVSEKAPGYDAKTLRGVKQTELSSGRLLDKGSKAMYRLIGQVFGTYWMLEFDGKLYIMDQHAAHEKVLFERFKREFEQKTTAVQHLAPPVIVTLSASEQVIFSKYSGYFREMCFEIEPFGGSQFAVYGVPVYLFGMNINDIFIEILDSLSDESSSIEGSALTWRIATMACKAAVKGNNRLSPQEACALIEELRECDNPYTCPHGRPTMISFTKYELDKRFKRIQD